MFQHQALNRTNSRKSLTKLHFWAIVACLFGLCLPALASPDDQEARRWLGPDGDYLPFTTDKEVLDFLRTAEVVRKKQLSDGINHPYKLTLEKDGVRTNAIFRTVDVERIDRTKASRHDQLFRDSYRFEVAAYELSRMIGLDNVPPAVLRTFEQKEGSLQLWVEQARPESKRMEKGEKPARPAQWAQQRQVMWIFDNLIYNFDRNPGNMLLDASGKLWLVDHTRSFKRLPALVSGDKVRACDPVFWQGLQRLDAEEARQRLTPYLEPVDIEAMLMRRDQLVERLAPQMASLREF